MEFFASSARTSKFPWNSLYIIQYLAKNEGGSISNKSNSIVISQKILFVGKKKLLNTGWRGGGEGNFMHIAKNGDKLNSFLVLRAYYLRFQITTLQNVAKNGGTSYEIHHSLFQNISRDRKIQSLLQKYILQKKVAKKEGGISTE